MAPTQKGNPLPPVDQEESPADAELKSRQMTFTAPADLRAYILQLAERTGRSQGQCIEYLLEKAITYERVLAAMGQTLDDARRFGVEKVFRDAGYVPVRSMKHTLWVPPEFPGFKRSGFISEEGGE